MKTEKIIKASFFHSPKYGEIEFLEHTVLLVSDNGIISKIIRKEDENYKEKLKSLNLTEEKYKNVKFYTSAGCEKCMGTGYIGRIPVFEIIYFDDILKDMLAQKKEIKQNFKTLLDDAMDKAKEGLTSLDEIMRQL